MLLTPPEDDLTIAPACGRSSAGRSGEPLPDKAVLVFVADTHVEGATGTASSSLPRN
jgi:hypothetical protein